MCFFPLQPIPRQHIAQKIHKNIYLTSLQSSQLYASVQSLLLFNHFLTNCIPVLAIGAWKCNRKRPRRTKRRPHSEVPFPLWTDINIVFIKFDPLTTKIRSRIFYSLDQRPFYQFFFIQLYSDFLIFFHFVSIF